MKRVMYRLKSGNLIIPLFRLPSLLIPSFSPPPPPPPPPTPVFHHFSWISLIVSDSSAGWHVHVNGVQSDMNHRFSYACSQGVGSQGLTLYQYYLLPPHLVSRLIFHHQTFFSFRIKLMLLVSVLFHGKVLLMTLAMPTIAKINIIVNFSSSTRWCQNFVIASTGAKLCPKEFFVSSHLRIP